MWLWCEVHGQSASRWQSREVPQLRPENKASATCPQSRFGAATICTATIGKFARGSATGTTLSSDRKTIVHACYSGRDHDGAGGAQRFLSLYTSFQVSGASQMIPIPDSLGGGYFRGVARHAEQLNHFGTILCVIFGGIQFAGGLCAINARYWPVSLGGSILLLIPCIGSAFPCFIVFTLPLGIFCLVRLTAEQNVFR